MSLKSIELLGALSTYQHLLSRSSLRSIHMIVVRTSGVMRARAQPLGQNTDGTEPGEHQLCACCVARIGEGSSLFKVQGL